ncbi:SDR family oxidoreductase [Mycetohabitans sp. B5]|uniref:NAD(P)-dependent dehydrogenase (Short-subunit alcohol dehydrogenase family) n=1 Tax=Mycetohabitans endofungorum TaxID=417203 RepID=A0A2P5K7V6_9BURK|nr:MULTISPECIES: SDR family oxidoreductase [Mycetohabitans]MCG1054285.1 SDR family oxidoreductase [Mycetohabitans sp. B5]PPB82799.1 NAD(P)-dependent dehydrogenase (short-subunit alcohol dehydrogenase family) [Mycetohabitans endofungorum]
MGRSINLEGKVALITGASSGLGKRFAQVLSGAGAKVVLASRRTERLKELRAEIEASGGAAHVVALDVTDYGSIKAAVAHAETEAGTIDILVNNSGVSTTQKLADVTPTDFEYVFGTNTRGAFFVAQEVAKRMIMRGNGAAGAKPCYRIINIASVAGLRASPQIGLYAMSKAAVVHMTKAMALEWGRHGINVNAICPGYIDTEPNHHQWSTEHGQKLLAMLPRKRIGTPEDLDGLLLLLAADESQFINGSVMAADDGLGLV